MKRIALFKEFCKKTAAVLFCTDLAARGLDFPKVDWVLQLDCPDSIETYIHRAGRTARNETSGNSLLFLCPSEEKGMTELLQSKSISIESIEPNLSKFQSIQPRLSSMCSQYPEIKYLGQKAAQCYMRSLFVNPNKQIFDIHAYDVDAYCQSIGLPTAPLMQFHKKTSVKNDSRDLLKETNPTLFKARPLATAPAQIALVDNADTPEVDTSSEERDEELLQVKAKGLHTTLEIDAAPLEPKKASKKSIKKKMLRGLAAPEHYLYDDQDTQRAFYEFGTEESLVKKLYEDSLKSNASSLTCLRENTSEALLSAKRQEHFTQLKDRLGTIDKSDKLLARKRKLEKKLKDKAKKQRISSKSSSQPVTLQDDCEYNSNDEIIPQLNEPLERFSGSIQEDEALALQFL